MYIKKQDKLPKEQMFDYKDVDLLRRYLTEDASILSKEKSGLTAKQQRSLATAVKRARHLSLLPFVTTL